MSKHYANEDVRRAVDFIAREVGFEAAGMTEQARRFLDAAAPAIAARALREAADAIADGVEPTNSPNHSRDDAQDERVIEELRARADAIAHLFPADVRRNLAARRADEIEAGR